MIRSLMDECPQMGLFLLDLDAAATGAQLRSAMAMASFFGWQRQRVRFARRQVFRAKTAGSQRSYPIN